jgi:hypothetical protein
MQLSELRTEVRRRSDMENSEFIKDAELTNYINQSYVELYDILISRFEDYYVTDFSDKTINVSTVVGTGSLVTVTTTGNHNLISGLQVSMSGWTGTSGTFDGTVTITRTSATTFTYVSDGVGTATGGTATPTNTLVINNTQYRLALPSDFYKMRGIDRSIGGTGSNDWINVKKFNFQERNRRTRSIVYNIKGQVSITYRIFGNNLELRSEDACDGIYRMWYIPRYVPMVLDTDSPQGIMDFEEYIIVDSAIKCAQKEESDTSVLERQKAFLLERIKTMAANRDVGESERVADSRNNYYDWEMLGYGR